MDSIVAGLVAAIPLSVLGVIYMRINGRQFIQTLMEEESVESATEDQLYWLVFGGMALAPFAFGALAGQVYGWIDDALPYLGLALGIAVLLSILAYVQRGPFVRLMVIINFAVALVFGILVPILTNS